MAPISAELIPEWPWEKTPKINIKFITPFWPWLRYREARVGTQSNLGPVANLRIRVVGRDGTEERKIFSKKGLLGKVIGSVRTPSSLTKMRCDRNISHEGTILFPGLGVVPEETSIVDSQEIIRARLYSLKISAIPPERRFEERS